MFLSKDMKKVCFTDANCARITSMLGTGMPMLEICKNMNCDHRNIKDFYIVARQEGNQRSFEEAFYMRFSKAKNLDDKDNPLNE